MDAEARSELIQEARLVGIAVIPVIAASIIGQIATYPNLTPWYAGLVKPSFNPPNWIFAPVWTALYVLMAFSVWRVLRLRRNTPARRLGLTLFFVQLALNAAWSWMFFAATARRSASSTSSRNWPSSSAQSSCSCGSISSPPWR
jgi:tryptophan-rich sensory protein